MRSLVPNWIEDWKYSWLHIPSGARGERLLSETGHGPVCKEIFLCMLSDWNRLGAGIWQYWKS